MSEDVARLRKAQKVADVLEGHGGFRGVVGRMTGEGRANALDLAGVRTCSERTWALVDALLPVRDGA